MADSAQTASPLPLREFAYLDEEILDDFLSALLGGLAEQSTRSGKRTTPAVDTEVNLKLARGKRKGAFEETSWEESPKQTGPSKFEKVRSLLEQSDQIVRINDYELADWAAINERTVFESRGRIEFSALEDLIELFRKVVEMSEVFEPGKPQDPSWTQFLQYLDLIGGEKRSYRVRFIPDGSPDEAHCFVADLHTSKLRRDKAGLQGTYLLVGRVQQRLQGSDRFDLYSLMPRGIQLPGQQVEDLLKHFKDMPEMLGRPPEVRDLYVSQPAIVATPIAIYR